MSDSKVDLHGLLSRADISAIEHDEDRSVRLEAERRNKKIEAYEGLAVFILLLLLILAVTISVMYEAVIDSTASPETKRWAQTGMFALVSGLFSFIAGRKTANKSK